MNLRDNKRFFFTSLVFFILASVLLLVLEMESSQRAPLAMTPPSPAPSATPPTPPPTPPLVYAIKGELAPGFPKELILDDSAKLADSYSISYEASLKQYTATYTSQKSISDLFTLYQNYFTKNNWTFVNQVTKYPTSRGMYVTDSTNEAGVAILMQGSSTKVMVSYIVK